MQTLKHRAVTLLAALALAAAGCQGEKGATGAPGQPGDTGGRGPTGPAGDPGVPTGSISGTLTYSPDGATTVKATGVTVSVVPDVGATATTDANGSFALTVPVGIYSVRFSGNGFASAQVDGVSVVAGTPANVAKVLTHTLPFSLQPAVGPVQLGKQVALGVVVKRDGQVVSDTSGYAFAWSTTVAGPTTVDLTGVDLSKSTLTVNVPTLAQIAAGGKLVGFSVPARAGLVGVSYQQMLDMTYQYKVTVTDPQKFSATLTVGVKPTMWTAGNGNMAPIGVPLVAASDPADTGAWTLTAPATSKAALDDASSANPVFTPDVTGEYFLARGTKTSLRVNAGRYEGTSPTCGACHGSATVTKVAAIWAKYQASAHGTKDVTSAGLNGAEGPYFSAECLTCHTTGYNTAASNGGFDDVAADVGWTFPTKLQAGNADAMPAALQKMNKVQCESCHGPIGAHLGLFNDAVNGAVYPRPEFAAKTCAQCHDEMPYADKFRLWSQSGHANLQVALDEGVGDGSKPPSTSCNRCHTAQGFAYWVKQQQAGNPWAITFAGRKVDGSDVTADDFAAIGVTKQDAQPQTCAACHDPHSTTLRVEGETKLLPAGFSVSGAGAGAICMMCHNSRNGARGDGLTPLQMGSGLDAAAATPGTLKAITSLGGPHEANQTDVFAGQNAFFTPAMPSRHMAVADTCVGCHVKLVPDAVKKLSALAGSNHTFKVDTTICSSCHGTTGAVDGEGLQAQFDAALGDLLAQLTASAKAPLASAFAIKGYNSTTPANAQTVAIDPTNISNIAFATGRSVGFTFTFKTAVANPNDKTKAAVSTLTVGLGSSDGKATALVKADGTTPIFDPLAGVIAKANWNYSLLAQDGSKSIHNPTFVFTVLGNTKAALVSGTGAL